MTQRSYMNVLQTYNTDRGCVGRKLQRTQSAILPASIRSFFPLRSCAALACATFIRTPVIVDPASQNDCFYCEGQSCGMAFSHLSRSLRVAPMVPSRRIGRRHDVVASVFLWTSSRCNTYVLEEPPSPLYESTLPLSSVFLHHVLLVGLSIQTVNRVWASHALTF
jgi:hypothetical protein